MSRASAQVLPESSAFIKVGQGSCQGQTVAQLSASGFLLCSVSLHTAVLLWNPVGANVPAGLDWGIPNPPSSCHPGTNKTSPLTVNSSNFTTMAASLLLACSLGPPCVDWDRL